MKKRLLLVPVAIVLAMLFVVVLTSCEFFEPSENDGNTGELTVNWKWSEDYSSAEVTFSRGAGSTQSTKLAVITSKTTPATCLDGGEIVYTATVNFNGKDYTSSQTQPIAALGHAYGEPEFIWAEDCKSATANLTCANDNTHIITENATVTEKSHSEPTCVEEGKFVYSATANINGKTYTDTETKITAPALGHTYGEPEFIWAEDNKSATAKFICQTDKNHIKTVSAKITSVNTATCEVAGTITYTATATLDGKDYTDRKSESSAALGHAYGEPKFTWNGYESAVAVFTCANDRNHTETATAAVTSKRTEPTCDKDGKVVYTATVNFREKEYTDLQEETISSAGHDYGEPVFTWAEDNASATAVFTCATDSSHIETVKATITSKNTATCIADGEIIYTATVNFNDKDYTEEKEEPVSAFGHNYGEPVFVWAEDNTSATAVFTCANDNSHTETLTATITSDRTEPTCTEDGKVIYTATAIGENTYTSTKTEVIKATGHNYNEQNVCTICGDKVTQSLQYSLSGDGTQYTVTGIGTVTATDIIVPSSYNGKPVISIGSSAFYNRKGLTSVTIPDSVTNIGSSAFYCCISLTSITIPDSVTSIGSSAFYNTAWYNNQPDGLIYAGKVAYKYKGTMPENTVIEIKKGTVKIADYTFSGCSGLTIVTLPYSVTSIGESAFYGCKRLTSITIPDSVTSIGDWAFSNCIGLTSITIPSCVTSIEDATFNGCTGLKSITIPYGVTSIGESAFSGCTDLTSIIIPNSVTSIGDYAFSGCDGLTNVTIPDSVTSIREGVFSGCSGLTNITIPDSVSSIGGWAFSNCFGLTNITIPDKVTSIGQYAFYACIGLTGVTIGNGVTSIGEGAFFFCVGLTSITIGKGVTSIGTAVFNLCVGLTTLTVSEENTVYHSAGNCIIKTETKTLIAGGKNSIIPTDGSVTSIGQGAFYGRFGITNITIPDSVTSIGEQAFYGCARLVEINNKSSLNITAGSEELGFVGYYAKNVYTSTMGASKLSTDGNGFVIYDGNTLVDYVGEATDITIPDCITTINGHALSFYVKLTSINIPDSVTSIGESAFYYCTGLKSVTIPDSVMSIGDLVFYGCAGLTSITIPTKVTSIGKFAFYNCTGLTSITIPDGVASIGESAFSGCTGLTSVTIPDSVTSIGELAFSGCNSLTAVYISDLAKWCEISFADNPLTSAEAVKLYLNGELLSGDLVIPDGVTSIGSYAFSNCTDFTSVTIPDSVTSIGKFAFSGCSGLTSATIGNGVTSIESYVFSGCSGLTSITIPFIGATKDGTEDTHFGYIFGASWNSDNSKYVPSSLKTVVITGGTSIEWRAFYNCAGLTSITIPDSVTNIGDSAFEGCTGLTSITIPNGVTSIGDSAFSGCTGLTSVIIPNGVTSIGDSAFYNCIGLTRITIPNSVTKIGYAFSSCYRLVEVYNKSSLSITAGSGDYGLDYVKNVYTPTEGASKLTTDENGFVIYDGNTFVDYVGTETEITIPDCVTTINDHALYKHANITSIILPESVTSIGSSAFSGCTDLMSVTIPESVTSIGRNAFSNCTGLIAVYITDLRKWCEIDFISDYPNPWSYANPLLYAENLYLNGELVTDLVLPDGLTKIGAHVFEGCAGLTSVTIPDSVTSIGDFAFAYCSGLTSVTIPDSVTSIGEVAFAYCSGLMSVTIPNSVTSIGYGAFGVCTDLSSITIPDSVTNIGSSAFYNTAWYNNQPDGLVYAGKVIYKYKGTMSENTAIEIKEGTVGIAGYAFEDCTGLTSITIPDSVTYIGDYAFYNCTGLRSVTIPDSVTQIGDYAFKGCTGLTSVTIPESVTSIGISAFSGCTGLTSVTFKDTTTWYYVGPNGTYYISVTNSSQNATNLRDKFYKYRWGKE